MDLDDEMMPYSPSADSSASSSDLDTESTGSFFPDRSTTLGTLMGVSAFGGSAQRRSTRAAPGEVSERPARGATAEEGEGRRRRQRRRRRGGSWWRLCRDDTGGPPTRLGEFLDMERQLAGADFLCEGGGGGPQVLPEAATVAATALFEDGRVRPPRVAPPEERGRWRLQRAAEGSSSLSRLPVLLTGICSGGAG